MNYLFILLFSLSALSMSADEAKQLFNDHLEAIVENDTDKFKKTISDEYYKSLKENSKIKELFQLNKGKKKKFNFDIKIKKAQNEKDVYFVNIKDKKDKSYNHNWYRVVKKDKFIIDGTRFFD